MHGRQRAAALAVLIIGGCGGEVADSGLALRYADATTLAETASIDVAFYLDEESAEQCTMLRAARPRIRAALGPFSQSLDESARMNGTTLPLQVPVGAWAVLVDAIKADGSLVGSGCAQDQSVRDRERASITLVIDRVP